LVSPIPPDDKKAAGGDLRRIDNSQFKSAARSRHCGTKSTSHKTRLQIASCLNSRGEPSTAGNIVKHAERRRLTVLERRLVSNLLMRTSMMIILAAASFAPFWKANAEPRLANAVVAIVHDSVVTRQDVETTAGSALDLLTRQYRSQPSVLEKKAEELLRDNLEQLVDRELILHDFQTGGYQLPESVLDDVVDQRIRSRYGDRAKLTKTLQAQGMTYEKFRQDIRDQFIIEALQSKNVHSEIIMSPHKIESYYVEHKDRFKVEDQVKLRMIVLNKSGAEDQRPHRLGEEILLKLKEGAKFSEMASVYSQSSRNNDWGWVERPVLRKELADVAFGLNAGETSNVIETPEACYLMLVEETKPSHIKPLGEVRDEIEKTLLTQERNRLQKRWLDKLRKKTFVRYF
jgi:peptidyl-prolyl cis-trans isomerase SurA